MNTMSVGILGTGNIASQMADTISRMPNVALRACASRELAKAEAFASKYGARKAYGDYEALAADAEIDLVYVATPHATHCEHTLMALGHGKAVLCEKPFALNAAQARRMVDAARAGNRLLAEAMWPRYQPFATKIRQLAWDGSIGEPNFLLANKGELNLLQTSDMRPELGASALLGLGVYAISNAFLVFGSQVESITSDAVILDNGVDGCNTVVLKYPGGKMATLTSSMVSPMGNKWYVCGSEGFLEIQGLSRFLNIKVYDRRKRLAAEYHAPPMDTGYEYELLSCLAVLNDGNGIECPEMPHQETLRIMELTDSLRKSWGLRCAGE